MYYLVFGLFYLLSLLPMPVLYLFSDFAYFIVYYVLGYRKEVVMQNLTIAFPEKSEEEKVKIAKAFYKNFCDTFIETIKFISASKNFFAKHFTADFSALEEAYQTGRSIQFQLGHNFNWELANLAVPLHIRYKLLGVYLPISSKIINRLFQYIRTRFGTHIIAATNVKSELLPHRNSTYILGLIADQAPPHPHNAYWVQFFGRPTSFLKGPEKAAKRYKYAVVFCHFTKEKRGHYTGHAVKATLTPEAMSEGELTKMYAAYLEKTMTENPEVWLWSHRRWKHEWKPEYGAVIT
jgi:KDO2-lipid IV(A) lauroyltransferase